MYPTPLSALPEEVIIIDQECRVVQGAAVLKDTFPALDLSNVVKWTDVDGTDHNLVKLAKNDLSYVV